MSINPKQHQHVLDRYLQIDTETEQLVTSLREELRDQDAELQRLEIRQSRSFLFDHERMEIAASIKQVRGWRQDILQTILEIEGQPTIEQTPGFYQKRREEFDRICALPHVIQALVDSENNINIVVRASYALRGVLYDLGDWVIVFGATTSKERFAVRLYRQDFKETWPVAAGTASYPNYTLYDGRFCIGVNGTLIDNHFKNQRYVAAIKLIIFVVNSINEGEEDNVPLAFKPYPSIRLKGVAA